jgi:hypothetical protein
MGLLDRVSSRLAAVRSAVAAPPPPTDLRPIHARLDALEAMVEGLQDSVDRQARRHDERLNELARQMEPGELSRALSDDARKRGL